MYVPKNKSEDRRSRKGWPRQFLHLISRSRSDAHGSQTPTRTRASPDERPAPKNQRRTAVVHAADSALVFSPVIHPSQRKVLLSTVDQAADGNQYKYKSPCVIVQQCSPKSTAAAAAAAEKRTVMAGGGMVRYSPFSWRWWWWATNCGWQQQQQNEKGETMRSDGQN